jgi:hypothetical protein
LELIGRIAAMGARCTSTLVVATLSLCLCAASVRAQSFPPTPPPPVKPIQKLGPNLYTLGSIRIDTAKREIQVPGKVNSVAVLEFIANTFEGMKAYESAITLDTDAIAFNSAMLLVGVDKSRSRVPVEHFDPTPPEGDRVEVWVEWDHGTTHTRVAAEELLFDRDKNQVPAGRSSWVYTGSMFIPGGRYLAQVDGVLIGFVHSPAPVIEQGIGTGVGRFGHIIMNPNLGLTPDLPVVLTVKAVSPSSGEKR